MPSDHYIAHTSEFERALTEAVGAAEKDCLTTFGIVPDRPETGYGYIVPARDQDGVQRIERFVEKPDESTAVALIADGALWNSGMFVFPAGLLLAEMERLEPALVKSVKAAVSTSEIRDWGWDLGPEFASAPEISIDVALMERTSQAAVIPLAAGWSDVGSWATLWELGDKDAEDNVLAGPVTVLNAKSSYLRSEGPRLAVSGVEDLIVVATPSAVLVTRRDNAQSVKELFDLLDPEDR
jgi:mannose-1-phosphate guanylyltransferase/mannose-6-phosphate isomerase